MKHFSFILFLGAALCIFSACGSEDSDEPVINDPVTDEKPGNKNDSTEVTVDWKDPAWYTVNFWERTDRQKAGLRGPVKKWHISNYTTYNEYEYDEAGHLIKKSYVDTDNTDNNSEWRYTYDAKGHRIKAEYFDVYSEGTASEYWEYEYNNTGKFVAREWFMIGPEAGDAEYGIQKDISRAVNVIIQPLSTSIASTPILSTLKVILLSRSIHTIQNTDWKRKRTRTRWNIPWCMQANIPKACQVV